MHIRKFHPSDLDRIYEITADAFGPYCIAKLREDRHGIIGGHTWQEWKAGEVRDDAAKRPDCFFVAVEDDQVVGYASFAYYPEGRLGEVGNNAVDTRYQRRGIGTALIRRVVRELIDLGATVLKVVTLGHDVPAQKIYTKLGFKPLATMIHYTMTAQEANLAD